LVFLYFIYIPEEPRLQQHCCQNLKSRKNTHVSTTSCNSLWHLFF